MMMDINLKKSLPLFSVLIIAIFVMKLYSFQDERMVGVANTEGEIEISSSKSFDSENSSVVTMPIAMVSSKSDFEMVAGVDEKIFDLPLSESQVKIKAESLKKVASAPPTRKISAWEAVPDLSISAISTINGHIYAVINGLSVNLGGRLQSKYGVIAVRHITNNFVDLELGGEVKRFEVSK